MYRGYHQFTFKETMQMDKLYAFVNEWNFDKIAFLIDLKNDIRTNNMLIIIHCQNSCVI